MWLKMGCLDSSRGGRLWPTSFLLCGKMSAVRRALPKFRPTPPPPLSRAVGAIVPSPDFARSVNSISTGGQIIPTTLQLAPSPRIFRDSYGPALFAPDRASSRYFTNTQYIIASSTTKHIFPAKSLLSQSESIQKKYVKRSNESSQRWDIFVRKGAFFQSETNANV